MSIVDHVSLAVGDYARSKAFYEKVLAPLGITVLRDYGVVCGFGRDKPEVWIHSGPAKYQTAEQMKHITPVHLAFLAKDKSQVDAFHAAALSAGAKDNGGPGLRPMYHEGYYGAFVIDPDGHNVEAVVHDAK